MLADGAGRRAPGGPPGSSLGLFCCSPNLPWYEPQAALPGRGRPLRVSLCVCV